MAFLCVFSSSLHKYTLYFSLLQTYKNKLEMKTDEKNKQKEISTDWRKTIPNGLTRVGGRRVERGRRKFLARQKRNQIEVIFLKLSGNQNSSTQTQKRKLRQKQINGSVKCTLKNFQTNLTSKRTALISSKCQGCISTSAQMRNELAVKPYVSSSL